MKIHFAILLIIITIVASFSEGPKAKLRNIQIKDSASDNSSSNPPQCTMKRYCIKKERYCSEHQKMCVQFCNRLAQQCTQSVNTKQCCEYDYKFKKKCIKRKKNTCAKFRERRIPVCREWKYKCAEERFQVNTGCEKREKFCSQYGFKKRKICKAARMQCVQFGCRTVQSCAQRAQGTCKRMATRNRRVCMRVGIRCTETRNEPQQVCARTERYCEEQETVKLKTCARYKVSCAAYRTIQKPVCQRRETSGCARTAALFNTRCARQERVCVERGFEVRRFCAKAAQRCTQTATRSVGPKICVRSEYSFTGGELYCKRFAEVGGNTKCAKYKIQKTCLKKKVMVQKAQNNGNSCNNQCGQNNFGLQKKVKCVKYKITRKCIQRVTTPRRRICMSVGRRPLVRQSRCVQQAQRQVPVCTRTSTECLLWGEERIPVCKRYQTQCAQYATTRTNVCADPGPPVCVQFVTKSMRVCARRQRKCVQWRVQRRVICKRVGERCAQTATRFSQRCVRMEPYCQQVRNVPQKYCAQYNNDGPCIRTQPVQQRFCMQMQPVCVRTEERAERVCEAYDFRCKKVTQNQVSLGCARRTKYCATMGEMIKRKCSKIIPGGCMRWANKKVKVCKKYKTTTLCKRWRFSTQRVCTKEAKRCIKYGVKCVKWAEEQACTQQDTLSKDIGNQSIQQDAPLKQTTISQPENKRDIINPETINIKKKKANGIPMSDEMGTLEVVNKFKRVF